MNLVGALRRTMATTGYSDLKEFQRVEVVVTPSAQPDAEPQRPASVTALVRAGRRGSRQSCDSGGRAADGARPRWPSDELQVLVVGGGVVGAGVALDAATRGLTVGLVEARDFGSGTSSRSSKLIHGGLRYLEKLDFGLVREALHRAGAAAAADRAAPGPAGAVPVPVHPPRLGARLRRRRRDRLRPARHVAAARPGACPGTGSSVASGRPAAGPGAASKSALTGALLYWDAQVDDARYVTTLVRTAAGVRRAGRVAHPGHRLPARGRAGHRRPGGGPGDRRRAARSGPSRWSTRPASGPTRSRRWSADAARSTSARPRASTWSCRGTASSSSTGIILRTAGQRAVRHPVGAALDHRHHRHRLGAVQGPSRGQPGRHRLPARPGQRVLRRPADPRRRRGRVRRAAAAAGRASPSRPPSCPASTSSPTRCPAW